MLTRIGRRHVLGMGLALGACLGGLEPIGPAHAQAGQVDGFRSAKFGSDEKAVRAAIKADFGVDAGGIAAEENGLEKTTALIVNLPALEPGGRAQVAYILGYKTKKLIHVNVIWGAPVDPASTADQLTGAAILLRNYFLQQGFPPERRVQDQRLADGSVLFFQGLDDKGRQVTLTMFGVPVPPQKAGDKPGLAQGLRLSYIANAAQPDVFQLKAGSF